jgi:MFS family permease
MNEPRVDSPAAWGVAVAKLLLITMAMGSVYLLPVGLKPISQDFDWPRSVPSLAAALQMIGTGLGGIVMGRWLDRVGMGPPALAGALAIGAGMILTTWIDAAWQLYLISAVLIGFVGNGAMFSPLITNTTRWFERRRGIAVAVVASGQSIAGAVWPLIFGWSIGRFGWRDSYLWGGIACLAVMLPLVLVVKRRPPVAPASSGVGRLPAGHRVAGLPRDLPHGLLAAGIFTCCVAMAVPLVHIVAHATDVGFSPARGAFLLSLIQMLSFGSRVGIGALADELGATTSIIIGSALQAAGLVLFSMTHGEVGMFVAAALFGFGFGGLIPCYAVAVRELYPAGEVGWRIGLVFFAGSIGMAVGGWMAGAVFDMVGSYTPAFIAAAAVNGANLAILVFLRGAEHRAARAAA